MKKLPIRLFILCSISCSLYAAEVKVCFTPTMDCRKEILSSIIGAETEILIQSYMFTDAELAEALIQAHKRYVNVLVIYDKKYVGKPSDKIQVLQQAGITTFADATSGLAHSKVMVIDRTKTITGSYNFTEAAQDRNVENLVLIKDIDVANQFAQQWFSRYTVQNEKKEQKEQKEQKENIENKEPKSRVLANRTIRETPPQ